MKLVLALVLAAMSTLTFAKSLEDYDASYAYTVKWPHIGFSGASVPVKNICVDGDSFKTVNDVNVCTKTAVVEVCTYKKDSEICRTVKAGETPKEAPRTRLVYGCVAFEKRALEVTRFYNESVCTKWKRNRVSKESGEPAWTCIAHETVQKQYPDNFDVTVLRNGHGDHDDTEVANINFELPLCK